MPKYYVSSGELNVACDTENPDDAVLFAFNRLKDVPVNQLGRLTLVSEHGFDSDLDDDVYYITCDILNETGQAEDFQLAEWAT